MRRVAFTVAEPDLEDLLDGLLHLLPRGVRIQSSGPGVVRIESVGPGLPARDVLEAAAGRALQEWREDETAADWRRRGTPGGVLLGGRVMVRAPEDAPAPEGVRDLVIAWAGDGFGSGSHPTTRMCAELLLDLEPGGGLLDVGCGLGTLAILGAQLGFAPVAGIDRDVAAVEAARGNAVRNAVDASFDVADVFETRVPYQPTIVANAPPAVHARIAMSLPADTRAVIASGVMAAEVEHVLDAYGMVGFAPTVERRDEDELWVALRLERSDG